VPHLTAQNNSENELEPLQPIAEESRFWKIVSARGLQEESIKQQAVR
jgi:hypothetical protein